MDKTQLLEVMIKQKRGRTVGEPPELTVGNNRQEIEIVKDKNHCKILGINFQNNLTWSTHLETGVKALLPSLRKNLGALKNLDRKIPPKSRNILAGGLMISGLQYLLSIWGGGTENLIRKAQTIQMLQQDG